MPQSYKATCSCRRTSLRSVSTSGIFFDRYAVPDAVEPLIVRSARRAGAARESGTDSFIFVFLSDLTSDANMFYRADRFLGSEIRDTTEV